MISRPRRMEKDCVRRYPWLLYIKQSSIWVRLGVVLVVLIAIYLTYNAFGSGSTQPLSGNAGTDRLSVDAYLSKLYKLKRPTDEEYDINETKSRSIGLYRNLPDTKPPGCPSSYQLHLTVSVVIATFNAPASMVIRLVKSVLERTPEKLLKDITVVDDNSDHSLMRNELFAETLTAMSPSKVMVLLSQSEKTRDGLVHARMIGMTQAHGDVVVLLDALSEVNKGWAEPLVAHLQHNPAHIVEPALDRISPQSLEYGVENYGSEWKGGFFWDLSFAWVPRSAGHTSPDAYDTPMLSGYAFAARREFIDHLGGLNDGHALFDGDHIDVSFNTWICSGKLARIPCSRVGNPLIPRKIHVESRWRFAKTWLGEEAYRQWMATIPLAERPVVSAEDSALALALQRKNQREPCDTFDKYLANEFPSLLSAPREAKAFGALYSSDVCVTVAARDGASRFTRHCQPLTVYRPEAQLAVLASGTLVPVAAPSQCLVPSESGALIAVGCSTVAAKSGSWSVTDEGFVQYNKAAGSAKETLCLRDPASLSSDGVPVAMEPCVGQGQWRFQFVLHN